MKNTWHFIIIFIIIVSFSWCFNNNNNYIIESNKEKNIKVNENYSEEKMINIVDVNLEWTSTWSWDLWEIKTKEALPRPKLAPPK